MSENLLVGTHKTSNPDYRAGWERVFGKDKVSDMSREDKMRYSAELRLREEEKKNANK